MRCSRTDLNGGEREQEHLIAASEEGLQARANLIVINTKQAAMFAISKGGVPNDPFYSIDIMLGFLPPEWEAVFNIYADLPMLPCHLFPCPIFITHVTAPFDLQFPFPITMTPPMFSSTPLLVSPWPAHWLLRNSITSGTCSTRVA